MIRHACLLLVHTNPSQVRTLLSLLDDPRNDIFVHIDRKAGFGPGAFDGCCKQSGLYFTDRRIAVHWGGVSIMRAELELLHKATSTGAYSYYHLLSGMDLPIKSQKHIHDFFAANSGKEFLNLWTLPYHTLWRVQYYTLFPEGTHFFLTNWLNHAFKWILRKLGLKRNADVEFRQGSQWFSITHELACYIVSEKEWVHKVFCRSCICDEIFIPTLVWRSPFKDRLYCSEETEDHCVNLSNMRFILWDRGGSIRHPWTFRISDYDLLMSVPHLWARKFDERVDKEIIDKVASEIGK